MVDGGEGEECQRESDQGGEGVEEVVEVEEVRVEVVLGGDACFVVGMGVGGVGVGVGFSGGDEASCVEEADEGVSEGACEGGEEVIGGFVVGDRAGVVKAEVGRSEE